MKKTTIIIRDDNDAGKIFNLLSAITKSIDTLKKSKFDIIVATCWWNLKDIEQAIKPFNEFKIQVVASPWQPKTKWLNNAVQNATGEFICIMDENVSIFTGFFERMIEWLQDPLIWIVCPRFTQWQVAWNGWLYYWKKNIDPDCFMFRKSDVEKLFPINTMLTGRRNQYLLNKCRDRWMNIKILRNCVCHHFKKVSNKDAEEFVDDLYSTIAEMNGRNVELVELVSDDPLRDLIF